MDEPREKAMYHDEEPPAAYPGMNEDVDELADNALKARAVLQERCEKLLAENQRLREALHRLGTP